MQTYYEKSSLFLPVLSKIKQRSMNQSMANLTKFDGLLFDLLESDETKAEENYAANYDKILTDNQLKTFSDKDYYDHAMLLDKTAEESVMSFMPVGAVKKTKVVGEIITGYTRHGINRAISKNEVGVKASAILDALRNPVRTIQQTGNRVVKIGKDAVVVLNKAGKVITTRATNRNGQRNQK